MRDVWHDQLTHCKIVVVILESTGPQQGTVQKLKRVEECWDHHIEAIKVHTRVVISCNVDKERFAAKTKIRRDR